MLTNISAQATSSPISKNPSISARIGALINGIINKAGWNFAPKLCALLNKYDHVVAVAKSARIIKIPANELLYQYLPVTYLKASNPKRSRRIQEL